MKYQKATPDNELEQVLSESVKQFKQDGLKPNELTDDYTLQVISDVDPTADIFRIAKKDPAYEYRFLRDEKENLSIKTGNLLHQRGGWQLTPRKHLEKIGIAASFIDGDGFYRVGRLILAFMPKVQFEKKLQQRQAATDARMAGINRFLKEGNASVGGKEMHKSMKGIQPAHKLGMGQKNDED